MGNFRYAYVVLQIVASDSLGEQSNPDAAGTDRPLTGSLENSGSLDAWCAARAE